MAVLNPNGYPNCFTAKGFGLEVSVCHALFIHIDHSLRLFLQASTNSVISVTENTPARFSRLKYGDEIITFGFVKNNMLKIGKGILTNIDLDDAAVAGKTLVLVAKRLVII